MSKRSPRLLFTQEERTAPELEKAIRKADKRMKKLEKAEAKIPKKTVKKKQRVVDPKTGTVTTRLSFEEVDKKRPPSKLTHALRDAPGAAALSAVHREIREYEQDNVGVESAHGMEQAAERAVRLAQHAHRSHKEKLLLADHLVALRFQNAAQFAELSGVAGSCTNFHAATLLSASTGAGAALPQSPPG